MLSSFSTASPSAGVRFDLDSSPRTSQGVSLTLRLSNGLLFRESSSTSPPAFISPFRSEADHLSSLFPFRSSPFHLRPHSVNRFLPQPLRPRLLPRHVRTLHAFNVSSSLFSLLYLSFLTLLLSQISRRRRFSNRTRRVLLLPRCYRQRLLLGRSSSAWFLRR